jgi:hypothetical protein
MRSRSRWLMKHKNIDGSFLESGTIVLCDGGENHSCRFDIELLVPDVNGVDPG